MTTTTTKERGIIFTGANPDLIARGVKTQTRRLVRLTDGSGGASAGMAKLRGSYATPFADGVGLVWRPYGGSPLVPMPPDVVGKYSPYGGLGDRLWVKEAYCLPDPTDRRTICYRASGDPVTTGERWRNPLFMPRWASRTTLEVTAVRVERLSEITTDDAIAEGIDADGGDDEHRNRTTVENFRLSWERIHGPKALDANPWVWVIEFGRIEVRP